MSYFEGSWEELYTVKLKGVIVQFFSSFLQGKGPLEDIPPFILVYVTLYIKAVLT